MIKEKENNTYLACHGLVSSPNVCELKGEESMTVSKTERFGKEMV